MVRHERVIRTLAVAVTATGALVSTGAAAVASPAETWRTVEHNVTYLNQRGTDDLCGFGELSEIHFNRLQMQHLTQKEDGSFHFTDFETGTTTIDFDDPQYADVVFRRTNTFHMNLTPGGTFTVNETLRESSANVTIVYRYHLTEVQGEPVVEREVESFFAGPCPEA